jgi:outer membrane autotransporter protein
VNRERDAAQTFGATVFDVSYEQDFRGIQGGLDLDNGPLRFGVTGGIGNSEAEFDVTLNTLDIDSKNLGVYAQLQAGGFFVNGLVKVDWMQAETDPGGGLATEFDATAWGARATAGFRFDLGGFWAEPAATLSWANTKIDDYTSGGATVAIDDISSLRGSIGLRVGGDFKAGAGTLSPSLGIHAMEQFSGDSRNDFTFGTTLGLAQDAPGTFGRATAGLTYRAGGVEMFVRGEMDFGGEVKSRGARAGLRLRF